MTDKYPSITELRKHEREDKDFRVVTRDFDSKVLVMAIHGGGIELGTSEIADAVAGDEFNLYMFEGTKKHCNKDTLHVTGHHFDDVKAEQMAEAADLVVSIHGWGDRSRLILVGGLGEKARPILVQSLRLAGFDPRVIGDERFDKENLAGEEPKNIHNRGGQGVQLEIGRHLRESFFEDLEKCEGRKIVTNEFKQFVAAIKVGITNYMASLG